MLIEAHRARTMAGSVWRLNAFASTAIIFLAVAVGSSGATYFVLVSLFGITRRNPFERYGLLCACLALFLRTPSRSSLPTLFTISVMLIYFLLTSLWSDSNFYRDEKFLKTLIATPVLIMSGYIACRIGGAQCLVWGIAGFSVMVSGVVLINGGLASSLEMFLDSASGLTLDYQRFGIIAGVGAAVLTPMIASTSRPWGYLAFATPLALLALMSGGRTGVLMVVIAATSYMSWKFGWRPILLVAGTVGGILMIYFDTIITAAYGFAWSVDAPETILRALYAALPPPEITRHWDRPQFIAGAIQAWTTNPIFGVGWGGYQVAVGLPDEGGYYPHNLLFEILSETGLLGLTLLIICAFQLLRRSLGTRLRTVIEHRDARIVGTVLTCGFAVSLFVGDWWAQYMLFIATGALLANNEHQNRNRYV